MSLSFLVLMGSNNIELVSYVYSIIMYSFPLLLVNTNHPVIYAYTFPVSRSARPISANTVVVVSYFGGKNLFTSPLIDAHFLLRWCFCIWSKCSKIVASNFGRCLAIILAMRYAHIAKFPFLNGLHQS